MDCIDFIRNKTRNINWLYKSFLYIYSFFISQKFNKIELFCLFIGYPRSGHTIIGALLDAHPEIIISIEADVLGLLKMGYNRKLIFTYIHRKSKIFASKLNATWTKYHYKVPGLYQGSYKKIRVIGDKKGAKSTTRLISDKNLLYKLESTLCVPIKMIHVVRNPFDNIATIIIRAKEKGRNCNDKFFKSRIDYYFNNAHTNQELIKEYGDQILTIYHEDFIKNPKFTLTRILTHLNLQQNKDFLEKCSEIVNSEPNITRNKVIWPEYLKTLTFERMQQYPFFKKYY